LSAKFRAKVSFPLRELMAVASPRIIVDVEVPLRPYRERGVSAFERAKLAEGVARPPHPQAVEPYAEWFNTMLTDTLLRNALSP
jgi:hypothetical protein